MGVGHPLKMPRPRAAAPRAVGAVAPHGQAGTAAPLRPASAPRLTAATKSMPRRWTFSPPPGGAPRRGGTSFSLAPRSVHELHLSDPPDLAQLPLYRESPDNRASVRGLPCPVPRRRWPRGARAGGGSAETGAEGERVGRSRGSRRSQRVVGARRDPPTYPPGGTGTWRRRVGRGLSGLGLRGCRVPLQRGPCTAPAVKGRDALLTPGTEPPPSGPSCQQA